MVAPVQHSLVITALGVGRPGIVNTIIRHVNSCGCNIEDNRLVMPGDELTFIMLLSESWNAITMVESLLPLKGVELELLIVMKRTRAQTQPITPATIWVQVNVTDSPNLIAHFTARFDIHNMNIAALISRTQPEKNGAPSQRPIQINAHNSAPHDASIIEQAFKVLCTEPNAQGTISVVNYPQQDEQNGV